MPSVRRLATVLACLVVLVVAAPAGAAVPLTTLEGSLSVVHADALEEAHDDHDADHDHADDHEYRTFLHAGGRHYELAGDRVDGLVPGRRVAVTGRVNGDDLDPVRVAPAAGTATAARAGAAATGTARVLVLLVTATVPDTVTPAQVQQLVGPSDDAWYRETSYTAYGQTATVPAWLKIAAPPAGCALYDYVDLAETAARAKGIEPADYDRVMLYLPTGTHNCPGAAGYGEVAGRYSWILGGSMGRRVTVHELGHNLGLWHAHSLVCRDGTGAAVVLSGTCDPFDEYGDRFDAMGTGFDGVGHFNAAEKDQLGWLPGRSGNVKVPVAAPQAIALTPMAVATGRKALQLVPATGRAIWLEYRRAVGNDAFLSAFPRATGGVLAHVVEPGNGTHLLDMTPGTAGDFADAALAAGTTYADPGGRFTVTPTGATATGVTVTVAPGPVPGPAGYAWVDQPKAATSTPLASLQFNGTGATNTVTRTAAGAWTVAFPGLGTAGGVAHVTAWSTTGERCQPGPWRPSGTAELVDVRCFTAAGAPADARFMVAFAKPAPAAGRFAFLWSAAASSPTNTPAQQFNSTGAVNTVARLSTGTYEARLRGLGGASGAVQVSAQGAAARSCQLTGRRTAAADQIVSVTCFNGAAKADAPFTLTFAGGTGLFGAPGRWAASALSIQPAAAAPGSEPASTFNSAGGTTTVTRSAAGTYQVRLGGVAVTRGHVQITAVGSDGRRCAVADLVRSGSDQLVTVACTTPAGARADTRFAVNWLS